MSDPRPGSLLRSALVPLIALLLAPLPSAAGSSERAPRSGAAAQPASPPEADFLFGQPRTVLGIAGGWLAGTDTGDLFDFDLSPATVITMFLLPDLNLRLRPVLFDLTPGTRIVSNTWDLSGTEGDLDAPGWVPDRTVVLDPCPSWCTAHLWTVPAKVAGLWHTADSELALEQDYQMVTGRLRGAEGEL